MSSYSEILAALRTKDVLGPVLGFVTSAFAMAGSMLKDRSRNAQRMRGFEEAEKQLIVLQRWFEVQQLVIPAEQLQEVKRQIAVDSDRIYSELRKFEERSPGPRTSVGFKRPESKIRRMFLLYKPLRARAWIPRVIFYSYLPTPLIALVSRDASEIIGSVILSIAFATLFWWMSVLLET
jgi:hypothetical protein